MYKRNAEYGMYWMNLALELKFEDVYSDLAIYLREGELIPKDVKIAKALEKEYKKIVEERKKQEKILQTQLEIRKKEINQAHSMKEVHS